MLKKIAETMAKAGSIAILPHIAADGDAIGSSLALAIGLSGTGRMSGSCLKRSAADLQLSSGPGTGRTVRC